MRYRGVVFQSIEEEKNPSMQCITLPYKVGRAYGMTMPVGLNNPGRFHDLPFAEKLPENIALLSEIMFKKDGKPLTVQEHHILLSERQKKGESMGDVLMYTAAASALEFKIPVEEFILKQPYYAGRFFYGAIQKAVREKKFSAKRFVPYWKGIDNATRREVGRVERVVVQDGMFILWGSNVPKEEEPV